MLRNRWRAGLGFLALLAGGYAMEPGQHPVPAAFSVQVGGSPGTRFRGRVHWVDARGHSGSRDISGRVPAVSRVGANAIVISVAVQKRVAAGRLSIRILHGHTVMVGRSTSAPWGGVSAAARLTAVAPGHVTGSDTSSPEIFPSNGVFVYNTRAS